MNFLVKSSDVISIDDIELDDFMLDEINKVMKIYIQEDPEGDFGVLENTEEVVKAALKLYMEYK